MTSTPIVAQQLNTDFKNDFKNIGEESELKLNEEFHGLQKVNFIEWNEGEILETNGSGQIKLDFKPFEIRTFKLV